MDTIIIDLDYCCNHSSYTKEEADRRIMLYELIQRRLQEIEKENAVS